MAHIYVVYKRSSQNKKTDWKDGKKYSIQLETKKSWGTNTYIRQNRLQTEAITRDKRGHYIILTGSDQQEDTTLVNIYAPNIRAPNCIKKTLVDVQRQINSNTIIAEDFNTPLTSMGRSFRQKNQQSLKINRDLKWP